MTTPGAERLQGRPGDMPPGRVDRAVSVVDQSATLLFAVEGGAAAALAGLDLFGVMVVGLVAATAGGMTRDVLLGDTPPRALRSARYVLLGLGGGLVGFLFDGSGTSWAAAAIDVSDAAALSLFAVSGASIALLAGSGAVTSVLLGTLTAVGGGVARDVLLDRTPAILVGDIYATAAALGALVVVLAWRAGWPRHRAMAVGGAACLILRLLALRFDWQLPTIS